MKHLLIFSLVLAFMLTLAGCGTQQEPLETWPITYSDTMACYSRDYANIDEMLAEEHIILHGKAIRLVRESTHGVRLELEVIESTGMEKQSILLLQSKDPRYVLKNGEEVVLILLPTVEEGLYCIPNGNLGAFRIDEITGDMACPRLDSLMEKVPQTYGIKDGSDLTLEQVYDLLVEMDENA